MFEEVFDKSSSEATTRDAYEKIILINFAIFAEKRMCLFLIKLQTFGPTKLSKRFQHRRSLVNIGKCLRTSILKIISANDCFSLLKDFVRTY